MLELGHGFRVVDIHARLGVDGGERGPDVAPERLERELHQAGIVRAAVAPRAQDGGYLAANNAVARQSVERPFVAFARLDGPRHPTSRLRSVRAKRKEYHVTPGEVEQFAYDDRFHGFVLDPVADGLPGSAVLSTLADVDLPVVVHGGRGFPPERVAETLLEYAFPVVLAGFGGHPLDREAMRRAIDLLETHDSLYLDTAGVRYRDVLERGIKEHPDRVLFGSGAPAVHPNVAVMELLTCSVPEDEMKRVFEGNPTRVVSALD
ncbi:amidohydrolase family protein [Halorarius halobius]|uniref:amidohydrolase family protein n=1 Tax=Halorarius halobius TaxID=2962671 RepID=UPI0020CD2F62|nr:amidohydrolase family protein [Halorarius halobius]